MEGVVGTGLSDVQWTVPARPVAAEILVALGFLEIRKDLVKAPAFVAERRPMVVIPLVTPRVDHGVDCRRAAQRLSPWLIAAPAVQARLGLGLEGPIVQPSRYGEDARRRHRDHPTVAHAPCFQERNAGARVLAEPARHHAAARSAADD